MTVEPLGKYLRRYEVSLLIDVSAFIAQLSSVHALEKASGKLETQRQAEVLAKSMAELQNTVNTTNTGIALSFLIKCSLSLLFPCNSHVQANFDIFLKIQS